jgi:hypothetical protein
LQIDAHYKVQLGQLADCTGATREKQAVQASNSAAEIANMFKQTHVLASISAQTQLGMNSGVATSATIMEERVMLSAGKQFANTFHGDSNHQAYLMQARKKLKPTTLVKLPDGSTLDTRALGSKKDHRKATNSLDRKLAASFTTPRNNKNGQAGSLLYPKAVAVAPKTPTGIRHKDSWLLPWFEGGGTGGSSTTRSQQPSSSLASIDQSYDSINDSTIITIFLMMHLRQSLRRHWYVHSN